MHKAALRLWLRASDAFKARLAASGPPDRGDANTSSQLMWMFIVIAVAVGIGAVMKVALPDIADKVLKTIGFK